MGRERERERERAFQFQMGVTESGDRVGSARRTKTALFVYLLFN